MVSIEYAGKNQVEINSEIASNIIVIVPLYFYIADLIADTRERFGNVMEQKSAGSDHRNVADRQDHYDYVQWFQVYHPFHWKLFVCKKSGILIILINDIGTGSAF